jgi:hypothetical protein
LVGVALVAAAGYAGVYGARVVQRRLLLRLVVRLEAVEAAAQALQDAVAHLAGASDAELEAFADHVDHVDRRVLGDVRSRAALIVDELDHMPLPKSLIPAAEAVADAAFVIAQQAACVSDSDTGPLALEHLGDIELGLAKDYTVRARILVTGACDLCGLEDTAVYGGGLYL